MPSSCFPQSQPLGHLFSPNTRITETSSLHHDALAGSFAGQTFLKDNLPYIDILNASIKEVDYYR